ncbi:L,D-transpeptidase family protein [Carboxylicivirga sediminis]|uniref:L,D-transpeptidase family protein n=1 Tax=Carboxylicivirga sediminis TaxID=2006564 RepID=A0A941IXN2_9BACT|nr:L,D-transpeptidase family protein [Carboxylicivirga sediminis]MBR8535574.1 L,D-transpeptidase family protein [Carboxylicivirga sediminis]
MKWVSLGILTMLLSGTLHSIHNAAIGYSSVPIDDNLSDIFPVDTFIARFVNEMATKEVLKLAGEKVYSNAVIASIYEEAGYAPLWQLERNRMDLENILESAYYEGLNPKDYHLEVITNYNSLSRVYKNRKAVHAAMADLLMTDAILSYTHHLIHGKVDQKDLSPNWDYSMQPTDARKKFDLPKALKQNALHQFVDSARSHLPFYDKLKHLFIEYDSIQKAGGQLPEIKYPGRSLKPGDTIPSVSLLKQRLKADAYTIDSINEVFDKELESALMSFQSLNGLPPDGIAGRKTYQALNLSLSERLNILRANMERVRWINYDYPDEFILINIASYQLQMIKGNEVKFECRVVVGKEHTQTPVFFSYIRYIVFNPSWHIPYSIASEEILPKLKTDKHYLQNRNMLLMRGSSEVNPMSIDFTKYTNTNFPYSIIQEASASNALGKVKFIMPNKYSVYLHDTPSKSLFKRIDRAFSHGCIRLEKPFQLAELLLQEQGYDLAAIQEIIDSKKPKTVVLNKGMPTLIIYMTCNENLKNRQAIFYNDIYGLDKELLNGLNTSR